MDKYGLLERSQGSSGPRKRFLPTSHPSLKRQQTRAVGRAGAAAPGAGRAPWMGCVWMSVWEGSTHLWGWGMWAGTVLFSVTSPGRRGQGLSTDPAVPGYSTGDELCRAA